MGQRRGLAVLALVGCSGPAATAPTAVPITVVADAAAAAVAVDAPPATPEVRVDPKVALAAKVVRDFETAVLAKQDAYVALFDFAAVGEVEILLHRYDLNGRMPNLPAEDKAQFAKEDGTPYPAARERRNVTSFYQPLAQRTVGKGGCVAAAPTSSYGRRLGEPFEPMPAGTPPKYEILRTHANAWLARGGVIGIRCSGGSGGLAVVFTITDSPRGYDLITIYDD